MSKYLLMSVDRRWGGEPLISRFYALLINIPLSCWINIALHYEILYKRIQLNNILPPFLRADRAVDKRYEQADDDAWKQRYSGSEQRSPCPAGHAASRSRAWKPTWVCSNTAATSYRQILSTEMPGRWARLDTFHLSCLYIFAFWVKMIKFHLHLFYVKET